MQKVVQFLHEASRVLAKCAVLAGIGAGLFEAYFGAAFMCVDSCPTRAFLFSYLGPTSVQLLTPCIVLAVLALAAFVAYCLATRQARRIIAPVLFLPVGGLVGVGALDVLLQHTQATLPVDSDGFLVAASAEAWRVLWGLVLTLVAGAWSGVLAYLQRRR